MWNAVILEIVETDGGGAGHPLFVYAKESALVILVNVGSVDADGVDLDVVLDGLAIQQLAHLLGSGDAEVIRTLGSGRDDLAFLDQAHVRLGAVDGGDLHIGAAGAFAGSVCALRGRVVDADEAGQIRIHRQDVFGNGKRGVGAALGNLFVYELNVGILSQSVIVALITLGDGVVLDVVVDESNLALAADALGAKMVQFSTDDVFAKASHHPYNEFDAPAPESLYGKSKLAGEEFVRTLCHRYLIVRSAWVYGIGRDFVSTVLNAAADPTCPWLAVPTDRFASPTSADDLTAAVEQLIDHDTLGIYHIVCQGCCSRYDFAQAILKAAHMEDKLELHPIRAADAGSTPSYTVLDNLMLRLDNLPQPRPWKEALNEYINSLQ